MMLEIKISVDSFNNKNNIRTLTQGEELDHSVNISDKLKKDGTWECFRTPGKDQNEDEFYDKITENIFNKIEDKSKIQKRLHVFRYKKHTKHQINRIKKYPPTHHITVKALKIQNKETVLKAAKERGQVTYMVNL